MSDVLPTLIAHDSGQQVMTAIGVAEAVDAATGVVDTVRSLALNFIGVSRMA
jgi:hypothetical protein